MGTITKAFKNIITGITLGTVDLNKQKSASLGKAQAVAAAQAASLQKEAKDTSKQRQALFATEGGILGEEVEGVGRKKRGTILGN